MKNIHFLFVLLFVLISISSFCESYFFDTVFYLDENGNITYEEKRLSHVIVYDNKIIIESERRKKDRYIKKSCFDERTKEELLQECDTTNINVNQPKEYGSFHNLVLLNEPDTYGYMKVFEPIDDSNFSKQIRFWCYMKNKKSQEVIYSGIELDFGEFKQVYCRFF